LRATTREESVAQRITSGTRDIEVAATVIGETESHASIVDTLTNSGGDIQWTMSGGSLTIKTARLTEPGSRTYEAEEAMMQLDNTFMGQNLNIA